MSFKKNKTQLCINTRSRRQNHLRVFDQFSTISGDDRHVLCRAVLPAAAQDDDAEAQDDDAAAEAVSPPPDGAEPLPAQERPPPELAVGAAELPPPEDIRAPSKKPKAE